MSNPDNPDTFFSQPNCDRCSQTLQPARTCSYFTTETICMTCKEDETELKSELSKTGVNVTKLEGCGYIPKAYPINPEKVLFQ